VVERSGTGQFRKQRLSEARMVLRYFGNLLPANIQRRDLTKGQKSYGMGLPISEPEPGKRSDLEPHGKPEEFTQQRLLEARMVLRYSPELAHEILQELARRSGGARSVAVDRRLFK
jgi:hypothetical protein